LVFGWSDVTSFRLKKQRHFGLKAVESDTTLAQPNQRLKLTDWAGCGVEARAQKK
jgi:hypothetical protein